MRARAAPLAATKIAIGRRRAALYVAHQIAIHTDAHRATGPRPFMTRVVKHPVQPFVFGMGFYLRRPRLNQTRNTRLAAFQNNCRRTQVFNPSIRARADEDLIHRYPFERLARF